MAKLNEKAQYLS